MQLESGPSSPFLSLPLPSFFPPKPSGFLLEIVEELLPTLSGQGRMNKAVWRGSSLFLCSKSRRKTWREAYGGQTLEPPSSEKVQKGRLQNSSEEE